MIDRRFIGKVLPSFETEAEASLVRRFVKAIDETSPIYSDEASAAEVGHHAIPLPPTFLFSLELVRSFDAWREELGILAARTLHGEQSFTYHAAAYVGDRLRFESRISDIYGQGDGAFDFIVRETRVTNQRGEHVADLRSVLVQCNSWPRDFLMRHRRPQK